MAARFVADGSAPSPLPVLTGRGRGWGSPRGSDAFEACAKLRPAPPPDPSPQVAGKGHRHDRPRHRVTGGFDVRRALRALLPALSLALVLGAIAYLNPRVISYFGFTLMLNYAVPIALATMAQMFVMAGNDIDLSIGTFVGFVCCVSGTYLNDEPAVGVLVLLGCVGAYAALGALIYLRNLPSIVVTLGMSFVWQGLAILLLPKPGGKAPGWLQAIMGYKPPLLPLPDPRRGHRRGGRLFRIDADVLRRDFARHGRQFGGDRPRRLVAAEGEGDALRAHRNLRRAGGHGPYRHHARRPTPISAMAIPCSRSPASFWAAANSSAASSRRSAR